jgi:hypothetical protein
MTGDILAIVRAWLAAALVAQPWVGRIYAPRLPEGAALPALAFFVRGGNSNPHIPPIVEPSVQFDCWGRTAIEARDVYQALYDVLQGVQGQTVTLPGPHVYRLMSAVEEVQGQDIQPVDPLGYHRVLGFFRLTIQTEEV